MSGIFFRIRMRDTNHKYMPKNYDCVMADARTARSHSVQQTYSWSSCFDSNEQMTIFREQISGTYATGAIMFTEISKCIFQEQNKGDSKR